MNKLFIIGLTAIILGLFMATWFGWFMFTHPNATVGPIGFLWLVIAIGNLIAGTIAIKSK